MHGSSTTFIGPGTTSHIFHVSGKAPAFRDLVFLPMGNFVSVPHHFKEILNLNLPKPIPVDGFYILDRFIDRFLKHDDDLERTPGDPSTERFSPSALLKSDLPFVERACDMLSRFSDDEINMELYFQIRRGY
jgi:hypothetical protein